MTKRQGKMLPKLEEIRDRRNVLGISQRALAKYVGISQSSIAKIELGRVNPPYSVVRGIFSFLDSVQATDTGKVSDVAARPVVYVERKDLVQRAVEILQEKGFKQLPVMDGELCVGCIYERTIARNLIHTRDPREILRKRVETIMDDAVPTIVEDTPITSIIPLLQQTQAVLAIKHGRITGIVTNADLLKVIKPDSARFVLRRIGAKRRLAGNSRRLV